MPWGNRGLISKEVKNCQVDRPVNETQLRFWGDAGTILQEKNRRLLTESPEMRPLYVVTN